MKSPGLLFIGPLCSFHAICCHRHSVAGSAFVSICDHILKVCEHNVLQTACGNSTKFTTQDLGTVGDKGDLIRLWGQRVKGQGHSENRYGRKKHFGNFEGRRHRSGLQRTFLAKVNRSAVPCWLIGC